MRTQEQQLRAVSAAVMRGLRQDGARQIFADLMKQLVAQHLDGKCGFLCLRIAISHFMTNCGQDAQ